MAWCRSEYTGHPARPACSRTRSNARSSPYWPQGLPSAVRATCPSRRRRQAEGVPFIDRWHMQHHPSAAQARDAPWTPRVPHRAEQVIRERREGLAESGAADVTGLLDQDALGSLYMAGESVGSTHDGRSVQGLGVARSLDCPRRNCGLCRGTLRDARGVRMSLVVPIHRARNAAQQGAVTDGRSSTLPRRGRDCFVPALQRASLRAAATLGAS
jgi:hypothetical protein